MPRKPKPPSPQPQAPPPIREMLDALGVRFSALGEQIKALRGRDEARQPLAELLGEIKPLDPEKIRQLVGDGPEKFRRLAERFRRDAGLAPPTAKPKQRRVEIPHADKAIDQMLAERKADPRKFRLKKQWLERVVDILSKKPFRVMVAENQKKTLGRWIDERIALSEHA